MSLNITVKWKKIDVNIGVGEGGRRKKDLQIIGHPYNNYTCDLYKK